MITLEKADGTSESETVSSFGALPPSMHLPRMKNIWEIKTIGACSTDCNQS
jgi:hypothetical protein